MSSHGPEREHDGKLTFYHLSTRRDFTTRIPEIGPQDLLFVTAGKEAPR